MAISTILIQINHHPTLRDLPSPSCPKLYTLMLMERYFVLINTEFSWGLRNKVHKGLDFKTQNE